MGVTVVLITCTYHGQEFIRVGYYVNNEYPNPELRENPPLKPDFSQVGLVSALPASDRLAPLHLGELTHWNWEPRSLLKVFKPSSYLAAPD